MPLPVDPINPRMTLREIVPPRVPSLKANEFECEDFDILVQIAPTPVFLGGPLKPPIL